MGPRLLRVDPDELDKMLTLIPTAAVSPISSRRTQPGRLTPVLAVVSRQLSLDRRSSTTHRRQGLHVIAARAFHIEHAGALDGVGPDLINKPADPQEPDERHDSRQRAAPGGRPEKSKTLTGLGLPARATRSRSASSFATWASGPRRFYAALGSRSSARSVIATPSAVATSQILARLAAWYPVDS